MQRFSFSCVYMYTAPMLAVNTVMRVTLVSINFRKSTLG